MPDSKPDILFQDGVCNACLNYNDRKSIDWNERKKELKTILEKYKGQHYDCIIPVSGGKDSHYQVITILEMGYKPLCITATTCDLTDIGRRNIENIKNLGVDYIEITVNPELRHRLNRIGLEVIGDISWPEHVAIFTIPIRMAINYKVPLIIWGENSQNEYGGPASQVDNNVLNRRWLEEFGGLNGMRVQDIVDTEDVSEKDMWLFTYPTDQELDKIGVTGIFLGYYIPWNGRENAYIAKWYGFETYPKIVEGSCVDYENLDNYQTGIHDYFKYLKFGFGRATDLLCMAIRRGQITREQAIEAAKKLDGKYPASYLGKPLEEILKPLGLTVKEFNSICEKFRNKQIIGENGELINPIC
jgi:N-acetyl sugar amidotransferase